MVGRWSTTAFFGCAALCAWSCAAEPRDDAARADEADLVATEIVDLCLAADGDQPGAPIETESSVPCAEDSVVDVEAPLFTRDPSELPEDYRALHALRARLYGASREWTLATSSDELFSVYPSAESADGGS